MKEKFQRWSRFLWLAYDHNIYKTSEDQITEKYLKQDLDAQTVQQFMLVLTLRGVVLNSHLNL